MEKERIMLTRVKKWGMTRLIKMGGLYLRNVLHIIRFDDYSQIYGCMKV
jgi:hypothetical protein